MHSSVLLGAFTVYLSTDAVDHIDGNQNKIAKLAGRFNTMVLSAQPDPPAQSHPAGFLRDAI
jgi:hypothetical protein